MIVGISEGSPAIHAEATTQFEDASVEVRITSDRSVKPSSRPSMVPLLGSFFSTGKIGFNWTTDVEFTVRNRDGTPLQTDSFHLVGADSDSPEGLENALVGIMGMGIVARGYPDAEQQTELSQEIARIAGTEISRRIQAGPAAEYLAAATRSRDGMNARSYAEYEAEKARLEQEARSHPEMDPQFARVTQSVARYRVVGSKVSVLGVGVDRYRSEDLPDLRFAVSDCRRVIGWFQNRYELSDDRATCMTDGVATAAEIDRYIREVAAKQLGPNDTFVFYFRGHGGVEVSSRSADRDGLEKYLLLSNSDLDAMPMTSLQLSSLFESIDRLPARRKIILIDGSFGGEASKRTMASLKGISVSEKTYSNVLTLSGAGTVILAASAENQSTAEVEEFESGLFSHFLVKGLEGSADDNNDSKIDILELHQYLNNEVRAGSQGQQTPVSRGSLEQNIEF